MAWRALLLMFHSFTVARQTFLCTVFANRVSGVLAGALTRVLHQRIGERLEAAYSKRARERAAELAMHFERGRDYPRAVRYLQRAGENATRRTAYQEALSLITKGLDLLKTLPDTAERAYQELRLQIALSTPLIVTKGYIAPELEQACRRASALCQQIGETPQLFSVVGQLQSLYLNQAK